jgi:hypothetical protein
VATSYTAKQAIGIEAKLPILPVKGKTLAYLYTKTATGTTLIVYKYLSRFIRSTGFNCHNISHHLALYGKILDHEGRIGKELFIIPLIKALHIHSAYT